MKKRVHLLIIILNIFPRVYCQEYLVSFEALGDTSTIDSIRVENLTQGRNILISGTDQLRLFDETSGLHDVYVASNTSLMIYPNPSKNYTNIEIIVLKSGDVSMEVYDLSGRVLLLDRFYLENGKHIIQLIGMYKGLYTISIETPTDRYNGKIVSISEDKSDMQFIYHSHLSLSSVNDYLKSSETIINMPYSEGDRILFKGMSGKYSTIITDTFSDNKTVSFNFIECTDGDDNNYPVVTIGEQIWMAENLAYLPKVMRPADGWHYPEYYYVYDYNGTNVQDAKATDNYSIYGVLYNWPAAINACPSGWHLPSDEEWEILTTFLLGEGGARFVGGKMKETITGYWDKINYGDTNESGFSGLPGGSRTLIADGGSFGDIGRVGSWWTATEATEI